MLGADQTKLAHVQDGVPLTWSVPLVVRDLGVKRERTHPRRVGERDIRDAFSRTLEAGIAAVVLYAAQHDVTLGRGRSIQRAY